MKRIPEDLIYAAFFFVDIVGLSNPILSTETQRTKIKVLNDCIYQCQTFVSTRKEELFVLPTGDGMLICFKNGLEQPIQLAIELHKKLRDHNLKIPSNEKVSIRIGCNVGIVFLVEDVFGNINLWGPGAILARRVMDMGNSEHILLTSNMADDLKEISDNYSKILHPISNFEIKHGGEILIYSVYDHDFGNKIPPVTNYTHFHVKNTEKTEFTCKKIIFNLTLKDSKNRTIIHDRFYHFINNGIEPIHQLIIGFTTNSEKQFQDLDVKIFDEYRELKMSKILQSSFNSTEMFLKLKTPIINTDNGKIVKIHYELSDSQNYFEHIFHTRTDYFEINFSFNSNEPINPKIYHINFEKFVKRHIKETKITSNSSITTIQWILDNEVNAHDLIHLDF